VDHVKATRLVIAETLVDLHAVSTLRVTQAIPPSRTIRHHRDYCRLSFRVGVRAGHGHTGWPFPFDGARDQDFLKGTALIGNYTEVIYSSPLGSTNLTKCAFSI
jgi:hypothetical protein